MSFLFIKRALLSDDPFNFDSLSDFANTKSLLLDFIRYFISERPTQLSGAKKSTEIHRLKKMTTAEKLQAAGRPLPSTVSSTIMSLTLAVTHGASCRSMRLCNF